MVIGRDLCVLCDYSICCYFKSVFIPITSVLSVYLGEVYGFMYSKCLCYGL